MHELSIAEAVVAIAEANARGRRVALVELKVGHLRQVVPSALRFAFELVSEGSVAEGAELAIEHVPVRIRCRGCAAESGAQEFPLGCPSCGGSDVEVVAGEELHVESLELVDEPIAVGRR